MAQQYSIVLKKPCKEYEKFVPEQDELKLIEFSNFNSSIVDVICKELYNETCKVFVVGDYAEAKDNINSSSPLVNNWFLDILRGSNEVDYKTTVFNMNGKIVLNYTKGLYYKITNQEPFKLFFLCSIGNGKGSGDYYGVAKNECGKWFGDSIRILDEKNFDEFFWDEYKVIFNEC